MTKVSDRLAEVPGKIENRRDQHRQRSKPYRVAWVVAAAIIVAAGIALVVLPGPAFVVIPIGLAMLALEFAWADRLLDRALDQADIAQRKAAETTRTQRILGAVAAALAIAAAVTGWLLWEIPLIPG